jgi:predicted amidohydrolase YtcJ
MPKSPIRAVLVFGFTTAVVLGPAAQAQQAPPAAVDLIVFNGKVVTVDDRFSIGSALAVSDGKIVRVGGSQIERDYQAPLRIDLNGRVLLPGFIDTHVHLRGLSPREIDLTQAKSIADIQRLIREKARQLGPGEWITGRDWSEYELAEQRRPLRGDLDSAAPNNPVALWRAGSHSAVGNSAALKLSEYHVWHARSRARPHRARRKRRAERRHP